MHAFLKIVLWLLIMAGILIAEKWIPPQESAFRLVVALTFLLWLVIGALYGLRGVWRFLRA